ncbi:MAG TPA: hypothetical protein VGM51_12385 [Armatimonadota bacterium]|jgi:hypothetical protein
MRKIVLFALLLTAARADAQLGRLTPSTFPLPGYSPGPLPSSPHRETGSDSGQPILTVLERDLTGQPVVAVGVLWPYVDPETVKVRASSKLLTRVQDVADAFSTPEQQCVPYAIRGTWVLAPGTRKQMTTDITGLTPVDVSGRGRLMSEVLVGLTARERDLLCSASGLVAGSLNPQLQKMVARALRPPMRISDMRQTPGDSSILGAPDLGTLISAPPDLTRVRIRAQLRSRPASIFITRRQPDGYEYSQSYDVFQMPPTPHFELLPNGPAGYYSGDSTDLPMLSTVPNTFKPSDLDGKSLAQPFGAAGVMAVDDAMKRLEALTGRKFRASAQFRPLRVFVGSSAIPCGDVADALRLALTASFRRIGDIYFLTWDRTGLGALQMTAMEKAQGLTHASDKAGQEAENSEAWLDLAMRIPFAADDPLGWTAGQRQVLFGPSDNKPNSSGSPRVGWNSMTSGQRAAIRALAAGGKVNLPDLTTGEGEYAERLLADKDLEKAGLQGQATVELCVDLGDGRWAATGNWFYKTLYQSTLESLRYQAKERADAEKRRRGAGATAAAPPPYRYYQDRNLMPARNRALMVPVLSKQQLNKLAMQMQVRGIKTLLYPVLQGGYVTIPSKAFPPHPAMGVANGWLACMTAMKGAGVTVIGYMEALAWRKTRQTPHWLDQHPDYLDVDILGRPLSAHLAADAARLQTREPSIIGDIVRVTEPEVNARLDTLLGEYLRQPGVTGLCLDAWSIDTAYQRGPGGGRSYNPQMGRWGELGYAVPDRVASILKNSVDPVDLDQGMPGFQSPPLAAVQLPRPPMDMQAMRAGRPQPQPPSAEVALATRLLPKARPDGAPLLTFATDGGATPGYYRPNSGPPAPPASVRLTQLYTGFATNEARCLLLRVPTRESALSAPANGPPIDPKAPAILWADGTYFRPSNTEPADWAVYDFRGAPEELDDSLRRVGIPDDGAESGPGTGGGGGRPLPPGRPLRR